MTPRNTYWLLDSVAGWQLEPATGLAFTPGEGDITLDPLPGSAVLDPNLAACLECPAALAGDSKGRVFVLDTSTHRVTMLDPATGGSQLIAAFGGPGRELRHFINPRALTILPSGSIAIADHGRVQLFSGPPYPLLHVWTGARGPWKPWSLASDRCGTLYILDRSSRSILRVRADGEWLPPLGEGLLADPLDLAVSPDQTVAVVDGQGSAAGIWIFPHNGEPVRLSKVQQAASVAFDPAGNLFAGTGKALVSKLEPDENEPDGWSFAGDGLSDVDGTIGRLAWIAGQGLFGILTDPAANAVPRLFSMNAAGAFGLEASFVTKPLDSDIETCSWHRIQVSGTVPSGTSLKIESSTGESKDDASFGPFVQCILAGADDPDCLIQSAPGRYLRVRITLRSNRIASPRIHAIKVHFPRLSYLQYLPAVFQDDEESRLFLERFLSIFQTSFDNFDNTIDTLWQLFDPLMTPAKYFEWLAAWVALPLDASLTESKKRQLLKSAFQNYLIRGTKAGLEQVIRDYADVANVTILEHFKLRNWAALPMTGLGEGARLWSVNFYSRLQVGTSSQVGSFKLTNSPEPAVEPLDWGANRFSVLFPANPYTVQDTAAKIQKIVDREKPAHTDALLHPIFPRLRVGRQATLGVDAYVGRTHSMILGKMARLRYDAVLSCSQAIRDLHALGASAHPRLGVDTRIL